MSRWYEVEVSEKSEVRLNGNPISIGQRVNAGLGYLELRNTRKAGLHFVRLSGGENFTYAQPLKPGNRYRLGARWGHRIKEASEESDPIVRVLRVLEIPVSLLTRAESGHYWRTDEYLRDLGRMNHPASGHYWRTDGKKVIVGDDITKSYKHINEHCSDDVARQNKITGATWAIRVDERVAMAGGVMRQIGEVVVWPACRPETLFDAVSEFSPVWKTGGEQEKYKALSDEYHRRLSSKYEYSNRGEYERATKIEKEASSWYSAKLAELQANGRQKLRAAAI